MFAWDKHIRVWQLLGAVLAVPAGIAGTYGAYRSYLADDVSCPDLRGSIITTLERNLPPETKRTLLHESVAEFDAHCAEKDPDARVIFDAAMVVPETPAPGAAARPTGPVFGLSRSGERRGWVNLIRRDAEHNGEANFNSGGQPVNHDAPPPAGTVVAARRMMAVWLEPQMGKPDQSQLQGRLAEGACVRILSVRTETPRLWAEVAPETCR